MDRIDCRQIESLLPPFVDGEADTQTATRVEAHLASCDACRSRVAQERTVRAVLRARAPELAAIAPPGLRTRVVAALEHSTPRTVDTLGTFGTLGWRGRVTAFAAAALLLLMTATALEFVTPESNALYAAQLAVDHMRCFFVEHTTDPADARRLQQEVAQNYGWSIAVPPSNPEAGLTLVAARRCPFWLGPHAHLLYRTGDRHVSLYVRPGSQRTDEDLHVLGHGQKLWTVGETSYAMVTDGLTADEQKRISTYLERATRTD